MDKGLYKAAVHGDVGFLRDLHEREMESGCSREYFLSLTPQNNNIIHIAARHGHVDFINEVLTNLLRPYSPLIMISHKNNVNGDTPLHVAAKSGNMRIVELLVTLSCGSKEYIDDPLMVEAASSTAELPWKVKNSEGNTPLHAALINGKVEVGKYLVEVDREVVLFVNNSGETPLHLAIMYNVDGDKKMAIDTIELVNKRQAGLAYKGCPLGDDSLSIIRLLLNANIGVVNIRDNEGLTPLLRAAVKSNIPAMKAILNDYPEAAEACDPKGRTVLHLIELHSYEDAKEILEIQELLALKDQQDSMGNTPVHVAVENNIRNVLEHSKNEEGLIDREVGVVRAFLESSANFAVKNKEGLSAADLINRQRTCFSSDIHETLEEAEPIIDEEASLRKAEEKIDMSYLRALLNNASDQQLYRMPWGGNLLHELLQACKRNKHRDMSGIEEFIKEVLERFPVFLCQADSRGDTPLHIMARDPEYTEPILQRIEYYFVKAQKEVADVEELELYCPPWRVKNVKGNTPLHEALRHQQVKIVELLLDLDKDVAGYVNCQNETPLHVLCGIDVKEFSEEVVKKLIEANKSATYIRDVNGLTPLLKAARNGKINVVIEICNACPESAKLRDSKGRTFLHVINMEEMTRSEERKAKKLLRNQDIIKPLIFGEDNDGKTPLQLAVHERKYDLAQLLCGHEGKRLNYKEIEDMCKEDSWNSYLLFFLSFGNLLPRKLEKALWGILRSIGVESFLGVRESDTKDYIQTMGLIAVLLATITFQAAIAVPGSFNDSGEYKGSPTLLDLEKANNTALFTSQENAQFLTKAAFWVFMCSDILTLCLSMMVLYCLLWIMTGKRRIRIVMMDLGLCLLQASFTTTMVAFMMGVFAITFRIAPVMAIGTCVICSLVMVLFQKWVIMHPVIYLFLFTASVYRLICRTLFHRKPRRNHQKQATSS